MTLRDLIEASSRIGDVLKMMPDVGGVDDEVIAHAKATARNKQLLGEKLVEMNCITEEQLNRALALQKQMRSIRDPEELHEFFESVKRKERAALTALEFATPRTSTGR